MEYKKVDKCTWRADTRQRNNLLKGRSAKCNVSKTSDSKKPSIIKWTNAVNIEGCKEIINEDINPDGNHSSKRGSPIDIIKDANFEYEEEWDIGGIPELLSELDADIEKSLNNNQTSKFDSIKNSINNKKDNFKPIQSKHSEKVLNNFNSYENKTSFKTSKDKIANESNTPKSTSLTTVCYSSSKFTGFSKGGHLISTSSNSFSLCSTKLHVNSGQLHTSNCLDKEDCRISMSSQVGNNGNTSSNISGTGINTSSGQSSSGANISSKPNNKMSIDHQATLDKGLKMKIKRTKPGTKSSEAKHEIVKATEQQQNGLIGSGTSQDDMNCLLSTQSTSSCSQNSNVTLGISNAQGNTNILGSKKNLGSSNNQNNVSSSSGNVSLSNSVSGSNNVSQLLSQGTKRGSSGHRRDKTKEKSSHSNRIVIEKNTQFTTDKESVERNLCHCTATDSNVSTCSNSSCIRKTENNTLTQRLTSKNVCSNNSNVPPGVFTPSADTSPSASVSNILAVTTVTSTPICTQTISNSVNANTPGPPSKEMSTNSGGNVKISSHIAAQLAAVAASSNANSGPCITASTFPKNELKSSTTNVQNQIAKQVSPSQVSTAVNHTLSAPVSNQKTSLVASVVQDKSVINDHSESPPAKRVKHTDNKTMTSPMKKEMVDICIGTSTGTITEPDCLGPCEPGTSVTLEGIVWHETEGGVLVVNVTWRGKTYVGTLLDCTRHDWAPPRFCDSPTEDLDARTPKGRGKRGRATITPDLSNFTETRSSIYFSHSQVHSKLRNGSTKGGRGAARTTSVPPADKPNSGSSLSSGNSGSTPSTSPTAFLPSRAEKRKSKDESPPPISADNDVVNSTTVNASGIQSAVCGLNNQPQSLINPVTGLNVQISTKKCKSSTPCAISPVLLECPEQDCSKKFKHVNGLRYHQSHAHGSTSLLDEDSMAETEEHITPQHSPLSSTPTHSLTPNPSDLLINSQIALTLQPAAVNVNEEYNVKKVNDANISQQLENSEKVCTLETIPSLSCEGIITSTTSNTAVTTASYVSEGISAETLQHEQQKQFPDIVENNKINMNAIRSLESNNQAIPQSSTEKSGVLRFGQVESKKSESCLLPAHPPDENLPPSESCESLNNSLLSPKKGVLGQQDSTHEIHCEESLEKLTHLQQNEQCKVTNKTSPLASVVSKSKKGRKSPCINDYEAVGVNTCNLSSREDVQSPAYSDISDDSTPVNESDHINKVDVIKNTDIIKKPQDTGLSSSATCASSQSNISSTLSSYGVYQFYQQQQFIVPTADQQQPAKNTLNSNIGSSIIPPPLTQQQTASEFTSKKEPPLDLITKTNLNHPHTSQHYQETDKDSTRTICVAGSQGNSELSNVPPVGPGPLNAATSSKSVSHFYAFNYMPSNYSFNVEHNFGSSEENAKHNRILETTSPNELPQQQQQTPVLFKEDRSKEDMNSSDTTKSCNLQNPSKQLMKSDVTVKSESIKQESSCTPLSQIPQHMQMPNKDHQGIGVYTNMYQRHPLTLSSQQLSREEELRRYYIFSDQQRRQNNSSQIVVNQQVQNTSSLSGNQQFKDDGSHNQQQIKIKTNTALNITKSLNTVTTSKESPKHKQEEESKVIKQEGQKPTMETQGPPPPPTSQYFLHPSYITSTPFGFDPSHPMYRNVLMPATSPYNTPPYHITMPRYHAPEDLSRNTGTKALDALHHAASQYYTTHKIHELSERALKSPNNSNSNNLPGTNKTSGSIPNIGTTQHSNISSNIIGHNTAQNQPSSVTPLPQSIASQSIVLPNKQDIAGQKTHGNSPSIAGTPSIEQQKSQTTVNSTVAPNGASGNGSNNSSNNINVGSTSDSRSPPPQRHVHTHHHTHVGLGYPMYPAPYGAAVLASQQAAAVAVINPFPPGPNK